ncbi:MAG: hypothetical protein HYV63_32700 [Candidatus Schekmanbacteria bacterium]|nr:hypothetical protein [Candidatus Schekmanbacteria bacterium]
MVQRQGLQHYLTKEVFVTGSTFSANEAVHQGAAASGHAYGGGLYVFGNTASLLNTTLSGNSAKADGKAYGGGLFVKGEIVAHVTHSTIAANLADGAGGAYGGGISHFPSGSGTERSEQVVLLNTLLSGNDALGAAAPKGDDCYEKTYTLGNNLLSQDDNCYLDSSLASGSVIDQLDVDPQLAALASNGGRVETHALGSSSPARGTASCLDWTGEPVTVDARGIPRDGHCDLGAYEFRDRR